MNELVINPTEHRRAAYLAEALLPDDRTLASQQIAELLGAGPERTIAVTVVLARNLGNNMKH